MHPPGAISPGQLLLDRARDGRLHHALILHGPDPRTLRDLSIALAKALNCLNGSTGDRCTACQRIERLIHPDIHELSVSEDRKMISVEQVRDAIGGANLRPYEGRTKVFIIDPADGMSPQSANALLKTLEEPAADTVFILLTRSPDLLLPTVRSRSQIIYVGPQLLQGQQTPSTGTDLYSVFEELVAEIFGGLERYVDKNDTGALLSIAASITREDDVKSRIAVYASVLRDLASLPAASTSHPDAARKIQKALSSMQLLNGADVAIRAVTRLVVNADPRLLVEQSLLVLTKK